MIHISELLMCIMKTYLIFFSSGKMKIVSLFMIATCLAMNFDGAS